LTKLLKLSIPIIKTIRDNKKCFLSFTIHKNIKRIFIIIIKGENKLRIENSENMDGFKYGITNEIKKINAVSELIRKRNFSKRLSFFIFFLPV
tara:strand:+ start:63 stop:341 length:279 start_codon:yes stop_codon:yes gene_type:complete